MNQHEFCLMTFSQVLSTSWNQME